jgi:hypothetical protein
MRQSLSEKPGVRPIQSSGGRPAALLAVVLSALLAVVAIVDQAGGRSLIEHATTVYAPYDKHPTAGATYGLVYGVAVVNVLLWLLVTGLARSHRLIAASVAVVAFVLTATFGVVLLTATEYGVHPFPPLWGILALLPAVAGAVVPVVLLRRPRR